MERYVCVHGHFYQPPRENPWLETIAAQDSAYPFHDWNERITRECYAPNATARMLDGEGFITRIVNNYAGMSFNFGPTLLSWLAAKAPAVYRAVLTADRESRARYGGHGSALAQAYNHVIMPLATRADKETQVVWGVRDFEHRFGRCPEGMWLPETAVDLETLDILAANGIRFTILSPYQAHRIRPAGAGAWHQVLGGRIDPTMPYLCVLPAGRSIALFFYDGPISQAVAFEGLLTSGERFAQRLLTGFGHHRSGPQLMHIATDGETYGHHHRYGEMALAYALHDFEARGLAQLTNYGQFLDLFPPTHEVEVHEGTAWSCAHGVERWRSHCGCASGARPEWQQHWRDPLRAALDWLRDELAPRYRELAGRLLDDPVAARNAYIQVILDRSAQSRARFLSQQALRPLDHRQQVTVWKLLEMQRHALLMYTSCGWFFDDVSGIETIQVMQYAGRALQLAGELFGVDLEPPFLQYLAQAHSNLPEHGDGAAIYRKHVKAAMVDLLKVGAHYALSSPFAPYGDRAQLFCYTTRRVHARTAAAGQTRLAVGRVRIRSDVTGETARLSYGVLHLGDHNLLGGVHRTRNGAAYQVMVQEVTAAFDRADYAEVIRLIDRFFAGETYSLPELFRDEQRKILELILSSTQRDAEAEFRQIHQRHASLARFLGTRGIPLPAALQAAAGLVVRADLRRTLTGDAPDVADVTRLLEDARTWNITLDGAGLGYALESSLERLAEDLQARPADWPRLRRLTEAVRLAGILPFAVDLWHVQNVYFRLVRDYWPDIRQRSEGGDEEARRWARAFVILGELVRVRVAA